MTDAFRCNGCGEYHDEPFHFVTIDMNVDVVTLPDVDFTVDDLIDAYQLLEGDLGEGPTGDFCTECGLEAIEELIDLFYGGEQDET